MNTRTDLQPDTRFGRYQIVRKLGQGGMGVVYLALDSSLARQIALKIPVLESEDDARRFLREARAAAKIKHPNVCPIHDIGKIDDTLFLTMPFIDGTPMNEALHSTRLPSIDQAVSWVSILALAMQALHDQGLIHRDLKPHNVMLEHHTTPMLMDFGLARPYGASSQIITGTGHAVGTPGYMSPEQVRGDKNLGPATDIYSLGVILYELLTGRRPFVETDLNQLYAQILRRLPDPPSKRRPEIPTDLEVACMKALSKRPDQRFATMTAFAAALEPPTATPAGRRPSPQVPPLVKTKTQPPPPPPPVKTKSQPPRPPSRGEPPRPQVVPVPKPPSDTPPPPSSQTARPSAPRSSAALLILVVGLLVLTCGFLGWLMRPDFTPTSSVTKATEKFRPQPDDAPQGEKKNPVAVKSKGNGQPAPLAPTLTNSINMRLNLIPNGRFKMGSPSGPAGEADRDDDEEQHDVEITEPFYMGIYEVTQEEYERVMKNNPSYFVGDNRAGGLNPQRFPVEQVPWREAQEFCRRLSELPAERQAGRAYRLPTEAEWEYACRGGASEPGPFFFERPSRTLSGAQANFDSDVPYGNVPKQKALGRPTTVGSYQANGCGLFDMHGNVWEWCEDRYGPYLKGYQKDPKGPDSGTQRVLRGGSWSDYGHNCRAAVRYRNDPDFGNHYVGFRVVSPSRTP